MNDKKIEIKLDETEYLKFQNLKNNYNLTNSEMMKFLIEKNTIEKYSIETTLTELMKCFINKKVQFKIRLDENKIIFSLINCTFNSQNYIFNDCIINNENIKYINNEMSVCYNHNELFIPMIRRI